MSSMCLFAANNTFSWIFKFNLITNSNATDRRMQQFEFVHTYLRLSLTFFRRVMCTIFMVQITAVAEHFAPGEKQCKLTKLPTYNPIGTN